MTKPTDTQGVIGEQLLSFVERIERLEEEKADIRYEPFYGKI